MADEAGDQDQSVALSIMHEVVEGGIYQMTVSDRATGKMCFHWKLPAEDALSVATMMTETITGWMLERDDGGRWNPDQAASPSPGEVWPDTP